MNLLVQSLVLNYQQHPVYFGVFAFIILFLIFLHIFFITFLVIEIFSKKTYDSPKKNYTDNGDGATICAIACVLCL